MVESRRKDGGGNIWRLGYGKNFCKGGRNNERIRHKKILRLKKFHLVFGISEKGCFGSRTSRNRNKLEFSDL